MKAQGVTVVVNLLDTLRIGFGSQQPIEDFLKGTVPGLEHPPL